MSKSKNDKADIKDEPGAEDRFKRGIENALNTPPKPFTPKKPVASKEQKTEKKR